jgi:photosystem II stability/assembly factor-like uncharacterized protein
MRHLFAFVLFAAVGATPAMAATRPVTVQSLQMVDAVHGYALAGQYNAYRLLRTVDGGRDWRDVTPGVHPSAPPLLVGATAVLVSAQLRPHVFEVLRSDDAGRTWTRSRPFRFARGLGIGTPVVAPGTRYVYVALDEGAAAGSQGEALFRSADDGATWRFVTGTTFARVVPGKLPFGCDKNGFGFASPNRGWAGGNCAGGYAFFYRTDDGGRTWRLQHLNGLGACQCNVAAPTFFTPQEGAVAVAGAFQTRQFSPVARVYWTDDGGRHWRSSRAPWGRPSLAAAVAPGGVAWVVTSRRGTIKPPYNRLFRTSDAGRTWHAEILPFDAEYDRLDVLDATQAFAYSTAPTASTIMRTYDGGRTWRRIHTVVAHSTN